MNNIHAKPKLLFFQYKYDEDLPAFLLTHKREHVKCLSEFFEVTVIARDCDYQQICDKYEPDLVLFESGVPLNSCQRLKITNIRACPQIPKLGFLHSDAFCEARAGFLSDMDHWGIETFFAIATTAAEHTPEIADNLFIWPNFVDPDIYRDYGQSKSIPVLFTGNNGALYPWRQKIIRTVSKEYPSLICPHPGYGLRKATTQVMVGEPYARILNASWFVPACGTVAKEIIRKHFEIPACKACLITEKSPAIEAAGFVDMINCVFAENHNILDKLKYLFDHQDALDSIIEGGYQLVHSRHTLKHRDQISQWLNLRKSLQSNQKIIQVGPFEALRVVDRSLGLANFHIVSNGMLLAFLRQGDKMLWGGNYKEAESVYLRCLNYYPFMPEPQLRLALCGLYKGDAKMALSWIGKPIQYTLAKYKAVDPDPVEWAYFIISLLCLGKVDDAVKRSSQFASLRHPELDRVRCVANALKNRGRVAPLILNDLLKYRFSIHNLPSRSFTEWVQQICLMLRACGQYELAETLTKCDSEVALFCREKQGCLSANKGILAKEEGNLREHWLRKRSFSFGSSDAIGFFRRRLFYRSLRTTLKRPVKYVLHRLEAKYGYFLPYRLSASKNDEFFQAIRDLTRDKDIKTVLVIGAALGECGTEALLAGVVENGNKPSVFCISGSRHRLISLRRTLPSYSAVKWYGLSSSSPQTLREELGRTVKKIKDENDINFFDVLLIDGSKSNHQLVANGAVKKELCKAGFVMLHDINNIYNHENYDRLLKSRDYLLVDENPGLRNGYAIFEKRGCADVKVGKAFYSSTVLNE
jgi:hypothetical protein